MIRIFDSQKITKLFLINIIKNKWQLIPNANTLQETLYGLFSKQGSKIRPTHIKQKDGSRLKAFISNYKPAEIAILLEQIHPNIADLYIQEPYYEGLNLEKALESEDYEFYLVWLHTFLNGARVLPILSNTVSKFFIDLSPKYPDIIPEDDYGILIPYEGLVLDTSLFEEVKSKIQVVKYFSAIRMCPCCGKVSDTSMPIVNPWKGYSNTVAKNYPIIY